ncbi:MAG TPA: citrate/2-methylcitrate synthase [Oscillospiraceae bacterium]|nr:citrate/2-methylcitrate synthase [Oscillospiraceae bacterium]
MDSTGHVQYLCGEIKKNNTIDSKYYEKFKVKRGLRNEDGTGVMAGITNICNVHGYVLNEGEREPINGELIYRGYNINDIVENTVKEDRYGFEEIIYLLLLGELPDKKQLEDFTQLIAERRELPDSFAEDMILKAPSPNIMNKLSRSVLALYSYDDEAESQSVESEINKAITLIARLPSIMVNAYQVKRRIYNKESLVMHQLNPEENTAQSILSTLRIDRQYTEQEAKLLDLCLMLHAEHGGGNNSTFACRVLTSSGTDAYSAYAAAIGALKGFRHGGANIQVMNMLENIKENVKNWEDKGEVADYLKKIINKDANDKSGLIYGMGHAVYTLSDPRAKILKTRAMNLAKGTEIEREFSLLNTVEELTPEIFAEHKGDKKVICANVDMYSGLVYRMLNIPMELYTPLFAISRMAGWSAHRIEEMLTGNRIIRPAYKAVAKQREYVPLSNR